MGIRVECPNGHVFKVKDKYAGKKGICPHCDGKVVVQVPTTVESFSVNVLDAAAHETGGGASSSSLLSGSAIRHHKKACVKCGAMVNYWHAKCTNCGAYQEGR